MQTECAQAELSREPEYSVVERFNSMKSNEKTIYLGSIVERQFKFCLVSCKLQNEDTSLFKGPFQHDF